MLSPSQPENASLAPLPPRESRFLAFLLSYRLCLRLLWSLLIVLFILTAIGIIKRWENTVSQMHATQQLKLEEAQARAAAIEARELAALLDKNQDAAALGAKPTLATYQSTDDIPVLPARDVNTILEQEDIEDLMKRLEEEDRKRLQQAKLIPTGEEDNAENAEEKKGEAEFARLMNNARTALIGGDMRRCILSLEEASIIHPKDPELLYLYAQSYDKLLNPSKAQEYYTDLFEMRDKAGIYFKRASKRLTYGFANPAEMRGKLAFGAPMQRSNYDTNRGEQVDVRIPILLAEGEELQPDDIYIHIQFFDTVNGRDIRISHQEPTMTWENPIPTWAEGEEVLEASYHIPLPTMDALATYGEIKYYGYTAKLYYKGEPLDCISYPSSLIIREYQLRESENDGSYNEGLLPDDGLFYEEAQPVESGVEFLPYEDGL